MYFKSLKNMQFLVILHEARNVICIFTKIFRFPRRKMCPEVPEIATSGCALLAMTKPDPAKTGLFYRRTIDIM